jgi:hypothetical protein
LVISFQPLPLLFAVARQLFKDRRSVLRGSKDRSLSESLTSVCPSLPNYFNRMPYAESLAPISLNRRPSYIYIPPFLLNYQLRSISYKLARQRLTLYPKPFFRFSFYSIMQPIYQHLSLLAVALDHP